MSKFKTLKDHVYDYLAEQIMLGTISPGEKINEHIICEELSISRTPVREALIELACDGILENIPRKGFSVKGLSIKDITELYVVIGCLEGYAAELACPRLTERDYMDMQFYIDSMDLAIESKNYDMYHRQQVAFHQHFTLRCGNDTLTDTVEHLRNKILKKSYGSSQNAKIQAILRETNEEHRRILQLLQEGNVQGVRLYLSDTHWHPRLAQLDII